LWRIISACVRFLGFLINDKWPEESLQRNKLHAMATGKTVLNEFRQAGNKNNNSNNRNNNNNLIVYLN